MNQSVFMDENAMNLKRSSFPVLNNNINMYGGFGFKSPQYNYYLHQYPQLLLDAYKVGSFRGSLPPLYSSLPVHRQPPLLPLPIKSATLPSSNKKITAETIIRSSSSSSKQNKPKRKKKNQQQSKPTEASTVEAPKPVDKKVKKEEEEETGEEFLIGSSSPVYSDLSPPPSSLPLPRSLLMRPRPAKAKVAVAGRSCTAEANASATDDLRKLLRL